ncbi:hypothetical protein [Tepidibacillus fermentans]|uniref:hypothetical protein n=1 Tax=Tepidibacillus fermentans TaxID=1281767 RepID=UPI00104C1070|nr:hypothetical protein [Tepidibacillus fermentans]
MAIPIILSTRIPYSTSRVGVIVLKKKWIIGFIALLVLGLFIPFSGKFSQWISNYQQQEEWNQGVENPAKNIKTTEVPKLDQLLSKPNLIEELKKKPYFIGYNSNGQYGAFLMYDSEEKAYQVQIYNSYTNHAEYSLQIPLEEPIKSNEIILAQEALDLGYKIKIPPKLLDWKGKTQIKFVKETWDLTIDQKNSIPELTLAEKKSKEKWSFSLKEWPEWNSSSVELFTHPKDSKQLTFVQQKPLFVNLSLLTNKNSNTGKLDEIDQWLYGDFQIVYDQNQTNDLKGYLAVSKKNNEPIVLNQQTIDQWIYLDPSGKMKWYGNSKGIFNQEGKSVYKKENPFNYSIHLIYRETSNEFAYYMVDVFDKKTGRLLKTLIYQWDSKERTMKI